MGGEGHMLDMIRRLSERQTEAFKPHQRALSTAQHHSRGNGTYHPRLGEKERKGQQLFRLGDAYYHGSPHCNCRDILGYFP